MGGAEGGGRRRRGGAGEDAREGGQRGFPRARAPAANGGSGGGLVRGKGSEPSRARGGGGLELARAARALSRAALWPCGDDRARRAERQARCG